MVRSSAFAVLQPVPGTGCEDGPGLDMSFSDALSLTIERAKASNPMGRERLALEAVAMLIREHADEIDAVGHPPPGRIFADPGVASKDGTLVGLIGTCAELALRVITGRHEDDAEFWRQRRAISLSLVFAELYGATFERIRPGTQVPALVN